MACVQNDFLLVDFGSAFFKERLQLGSVEASVVLLIEFHPNATSRIEMLS